MGDQQDKQGIKSMGWGERQYEPSRSGPSGPNSVRPIGTYWIIGATVALQAAVWAFLGPAHASSTNAWGALTNEVFLSGQVWRLFTYLILHGSGMHLFFNMLMVYVVGSFLEAQMGPLRLVRLYVIFGVIAALGYLHHPLRAAHARRFIGPSLEMVEEIQRTGDIFFPSNWLDATLTGHSSSEAADIVRRFLDGLAPDFPHRLRAKILRSADLLLRSR